MIDQNEVLDMVAYYVSTMIDDTIGCDNDSVQFPDPLDRSDVQDVEGPMDAQTDRMFDEMLGIVEKLHTSWETWSGFAEPVRRTKVAWNGILLFDAASTDETKCITQEQWRAVLEPTGLLEDGVDRCKVLASRFQEIAGKW